MPDGPRFPERLDLDRCLASRVGRLRAVAEAAAGRAWLVGGAVRDALLGRPVLDLDVLIEGDALKLAAALPARRVKSTEFGTVTVEWPDGEAWDLVSARAESYLQPGSLPICRPGTLDEDLRRRDFSIHALAVALSAARWGEVHDVVGGRADLARRQLRVLHAASFQDDPTRLFRAARYAARLGFGLSAETAALAAAAVTEGFVERLTPARVRHELERSLADEPIREQLAGLAALGLWAAVVPGLQYDPGRLSRLAAAAARAGLRLRADTWLAAMLPETGAPAVAEALCARLAPPGPVADGWRRLAALLAAGPWPAGGAVSVVAERIAPLDEEGGLVLAAIWPGLAADLQACRERWPGSRPVLDGHALLALGVRPGPMVGEYLRRLRRLRLDERVADRAGEVAWVTEWLAREAGDE